MSGFSVASNQHLIETTLWSRMMKDILEAELIGTRWVRMFTESGGSDTVNIPSIGQMTAYDYAEGQQVQYSAFDTGNFEFTITEYVASGTYISEKFKQDSIFQAEVVSSFVPKMTRAILTRLEQDLLAAGPNGQTAANLNTINEAHHRLVGSGTNETISIDDFRKARHALAMANVPETNLIAIVDPSVAFELGSNPNLLNFSNNPMWEGVITTGLSSGMTFFKNIWGFDVYVSQFLKKNTASEQINGVTAALGVNNLFFSATPDLLPVICQIKQQPKVDQGFNKDYQRDEYVITARWGQKLFRPENMVVILTDTDQVYA